MQRTPHRSIARRDVDRSRNNVFGTVATVIRRHGCSQHRSPQAVTTTLLATWSGRLGLLLAALGLVLMHHVVGAHQHSAAGNVPSGASAPALEHGADGHHPAAHNALRPEVATVLPGVDSTSSAALLHDHSNKGRQDAGALLHMCLATLAGAAALLVLLLVTSRFASQASVGARVAAVNVPRPPPTPTRLAQLQVLRL